MPCRLVRLCVKQIITSSMSNLNPKKKMFIYRLLFWWAISVVAFLSYLLLSYAFRDFSFLLLVQSTFTFLGLIIPTVLLTKYYNPQPNVVLVTEDEKTGKLSPINFYFFPQANLSFITGIQPYINWINCYRYRDFKIRIFNR